MTQVIYQGPAATRYQRLRDGVEFTELRRRHRRFIFPMSLFFLVWYLAYVLLAAYAPNFMASRVAGNITTGLLVGVLQFVSTFGIATGYVLFANRNLDPLARRVREQAEGR